MSDSQGYQEENLTQRRHQDPDLHWIGEALPAPSDAETAIAGSRNFAGRSPFPARSDHEHDYRPSYSYLVSSAKVVNPGAAAYIDTLVFGGFGENYLNPGSSQLIVFPYAGFYCININYTIVKNGGVGFNLGSFYRIRYDLFNATGQYEAIVDTPAYNTMTYLRNNLWFPVAVGSGGGTNNLQIRYDHNDGASHSVGLDAIVIKRMAL